MIIRKIAIENFRGITALSVDFDETTVLFGSNNTGKSTILAAIHCVLSRASGARSVVFSEYDFHLDENSQPTESPPIAITVIFQESAADEWPEDKVQQLGNVVGIGTDGLQMVTLRLSGKYDDALGAFTSTFEFLDPTGQPYPPNPNTVRRLQQIIPTFYLAALRDAAREFRSNAQFWGPFVKSLKIDPDIREKIEADIAALNQQVLDAHDGFNSVKERLAKSADLVPLGGGASPVNIEALPARVFDILAKTQVMLSGVSGAHLPLSQHGEGTQSLAVVCLFDAFLAARLIGEFGAGAVPILTLEEPEAHLHPSAVRAAGQMIAELAGQKIITTHSGDLLAAVPLKALRRLRRTGNQVDVFRIRGGAIDEADLCRLDHHIRRLRGGVLFARVWILVEGETEETVIQEMGRILGKDLFALGVCCFKFTELSIEKYIRLADELGIHWIATADSDPAGGAYIATAQGLLNGRPQGDHIAPLPAWDIETCLCIQGYGHIYQATISPQKAQNNPNPHPAGTDDYWKFVVNKLQPKTGKPERVRKVIEEIEGKGAGAVPAYLKNLVNLAIEKAKEGA